MTFDIAIHPHDEPSPAGPAAETAAGSHRLRLLVSILLALVVTAGLMAAVLALVDQPDWWRGMLAAGAASLLAGIVSAFAMVRGMAGTIERIVAFYFIAMGIRLVISLGGCGVAILLGFPAVPTLLLIVPFYLALLVVELVYVSKLLLSATGGKRS